MFYYVLLSAAFAYFFFLFDLWRWQRHTLPENDRVLLAIVLAVTLSLPLLGLFHLAWFPTLAAMAAAVAFNARRDAIAKRFRPAAWHGAARRGARLPIVWVMVSIAGLFNWAWYW